MEKNEAFSLDDPFDLELNLKRSSMEMGSENHSKEENEAKKACIDDEPKKGFGWEICVYNEDMGKNQTFHVSEEVGKRFNYFRLLGERSSTLEGNSEVQTTFEIAKIIFQDYGHNNNGIFRKLTPDNLEIILITLDYMGFLPMVGSNTKCQEGEEFDVDVFWSMLARKLSCFDWFECESSIVSMKIRQKILNLSLKLQNGFKLLLELVQYHQMRDVVISLEGGRIIREIFKNKSEIYGIRIINTICESLGAQWSPEISKVEDFLKGVTEENDIFDAISHVWQPTLWYISERKTINKFAQSSPHVITGEMSGFPIELELYADQDNEGSATTVNFAMETLPPSPDASITSVTSLGIFAYPKTRCTGFFNCFAARAKFYFENTFLGEATFDLSSDGIKAFCPIISGGPNKTGLLVTCRIDEFVKKNKDELLKLLMENQAIFRNSETLRILQPSLNNNISLDQITISHLNVDIKIRFFPLRTLTLYLLYKKSLEVDTKFVTKFSFSLQQDVAEWLGTYFTCVWIQISKQRDSLFTNRYKSILSLSSKSLRGQKGTNADLSVKHSENNTPNPSTRYSSSSSSSSSDSLDFLSLIENERHLYGESPHDNLLRTGSRTSSAQTSDFIGELSQDSELKDNPFSSCFSDTLSNTCSKIGVNNCYIDPISPGISPFPLITAWFKGVGKPSDSWCIHNILSEILSDDLITRHFTDVLTLIQTCESWVDAESLSNIRQQFIHFMNNNKLDSIGALLFDWIRRIPKSQVLELKD
ncbi:hypothetical protein [Cryptosporidium parvum Iowa II]|uniref:Uncharacterized protein n=2 Tax=Cryptosporidium parvum TaxID=5807 RepID=Q5CSH2_CRYPI|nr:hypothetical protein [Cryptosporidium parvum Iowa II]EAK88358.1 hypothetical protein with predicted apicomplexan-conserved domain [Cryptosporidium parvum Iowa II]QOY43353.1 Uncharacterized protein CPATCC_0036590 [Cryptosporidium parvum]WKS76175.1 hypothetical protein CPCDC_1g2720 [Cryptosporidium sp. 43IA8]WRK30667.1 Uncharacterized protein cpbgf_1002720 [Cryptosporidium parvum]|eukprot:QOY43353.1 hypothetical protein CPATCC_000133 [Cryptosporidium parvum]